MGVRSFSRASAEGGEGSAGFRHDAALRGFCTEAEIADSWGNPITSKEPSHRVIAHPNDGYEGLTSQLCFSYPDKAKTPNSQTNRPQPPAQHPAPAMPHLLPHSSALHSETHRHSNAMSPLCCPMHKRSTKTSPSSSTAQGLFSVPCHEVSSFCQQEHLYFADSLWIIIIL